MDASFDISSSAWILDLAKLKAFIASGVLNRNDLDGIIAPQYLYNVYKGCRQFFYWNQRLDYKAYNKVLTLTFLNSSGLIKPDIIKFQLAINDLLGPGKIIGINYPENTNFVSFLMDSEEAALQVKQKIGVINESIICYTDNKPDRFFRVRILWASLYYSIEELIEFLSVWCEKADISFELEKFKNGELIPNNRAIGSIIIKEGIELSSLPHVFKLVNTTNKHALLIIKDRPPLCLRCRCVGHIRRNCDLVRCLKCGATHSNKVTCPPISYATVTGRSLMTSYTTQLQSQNNFENTNLLDLTAGSSDSAFKSQKAKLESTNSKMELSFHMDYDNTPGMKDITSEVQEDDFQLCSRRITRSMNKKGIVSPEDIATEAIQIELAATSIFHSLSDEADTDDDEITTPLESNDESTLMHDKPEAHVRTTYLLNSSQKEQDIPQKKNLRQSFLKDTQINNKPINKKRVLKDNGLSEKESHTSKKKKNRGKTLLHEGTSEKLIGAGENPGTVTLIQESSSLFKPTNVTDIHIPPCKAETSPDKTLIDEGISENPIVTCENPNNESSNSESLLPPKQTNNNDQHIPLHKEAHTPQKRRLNSDYHANIAPIECISGYAICNGSENYPHSVSIGFTLPPHGIHPCDMCGLRYYHRL